MRALSLREKKEFERIVLLHLDELHRLALSLCHQEERAEEFVAQSIAKACESFQRLRDKKKARAWLMKILSNTIRSFYRTQRRHPAISMEEDDHGDEHFSLFNELSQPFLLWWGNPERELMSKLMDEDIQRALGTLPVDFRLAVVLCDVEGLRYGEIAEILNVPVGTIRSRLARGRSLLQKQLWHHAKDLGIVQPNRKQHETIQTTSQHH